ncbi:UNVERIFIED_CONTAM: hypothetical protein GTU68_011941 [Idotea baltica]|nr:hypothetical protein [Idotea baltica]
MSAPKTLYDKIWDAHVAHEAEDGTCLLYIDRHLVHEVTSPQAFEGLRNAGRAVRAPEKTIAVPDHNVPTTTDRVNGIDNEESRIQVDALDKNAKDFGIHYYPVSDVRQGIVHIVGPEQGWTLPGMTVVCGDSHTATHGAFGALAHGIGTSEVEHVLATQTLIQSEDIAPSVTWGTSPEDVLPIDAVVPNPSDFKGGKVDAVARSLAYMGLTPGQKLSDIDIDTVFIGSCTNGRIEDLRAAAEILKGKKIKDGMRAMVVPGSGLVRAQAEEEGLAQIFIDAGFEWRMAGCSMCLAMNPDQLAPEERCAATSNRNFEGRQGRGGRTHLLSPAMAAAAAVTGKLTDIRTF